MTTDLSADSLAAWVERVLTASAESAERQRDCIAQLLAALKAERATSADLARRLALTTTNQPKGQP
jgi:hypothetical protein